MSFIKPETETEAEAEAAAVTASIAMDVTPALAPASDPVPSAGPEFTSSAPAAALQQSPQPPQPPQPPAPELKPRPLNSTSMAVSVSRASSRPATPPASLPSTQPESQSPYQSLNDIGNNSTTFGTGVAKGPNTTSALDRGPLGLTEEEEEWVKGKMEYALHDFEVLALAIKRYKWQLSQVPKDIERLQSLKERHMEDPFEFLRQIKSKEFRYPEGQRTLPAPSLEWTKYQYPPANPVHPSKPPRATYLSPVSFSKHHGRTTNNVVSLAQTTDSRSRAGSPSYELMQTVKDAAKNLGIANMHHYQPLEHYHHRQDHQEHRPHEQRSQDVEVQPMSHIETNGIGAGRDEEMVVAEAREPSKQPSLEPLEPERVFTPSPGVVARSQDMEDVVYSGSETLISGYRSGSTSAPQPAESALSQIIEPESLPQPESQPQAQPLVQVQPVPIPSNPHLFEPPAENLTIDHSLGTNIIVNNNSLIQPGDLVTDSNITYNHMSGTIDIHPENTGTSISGTPALSSPVASTTGTAKPRGASREGSEAPKPPLFNIPWSDEEQQLLEKLLQVYPDEPVAAQRFQKISAAMGTRTPKQVASRVQKYFIKLVKAGLEAPGRMNYSLETSRSKTKTEGSTSAKTEKDKEKAKGKKRKDGPGETGAPGSAPSKPKAPRSRKKEVKVEATSTGPSGFGSAFAVSSNSGTKKKKAKSLLGTGFGRTSGTQYLHYNGAPTVYMSEEDDEDSVQDMLGASNGNNTYVNHHGSSSRRESPDGGIASHIGYSCDSCGVEPILGIRYSCMDCEELGGTDLCGLCYNSGQYHNELHLLSHRFQAIETAEMPAYSHDYRSSSGGPSGASGVYQS